MNDTIWLYWEDVNGREKPVYYDLCQKSVLHHNPTARIIGKEETRELLGGLPPEIDNVYIAHRSDWIRKAILYKFGGMWLDSDFVCMENMDGLLSMAQSFDFVGYKEWGSDLMDNFFVCRAGSKIVGAAADEALRLIREGRKLKWLETNRGAIVHGFNRYKWQNRWAVLPTHLFSPVNCNQADWFFDHEPMNTIPGHAPASFGYMTSYHAMGERIYTRTLHELMTGSFRLSNILRYAFRENVRQN